MNTAGRQNGFVIAVTLMVMLLLELLAAGMLLLAIQERSIANARRDAGNAAARAESAIARQVGSWMDADHFSMRTGAVRSDRTDSVTVTIERLRGDLFLLTGEAPLQPSEPSSGSARASLLLRAFDAELLLRQLNGALVASSHIQLLGSTVVDGIPEQHACEGPAGEAAIATPFPQDVAISSAVELEGRPTVLLDTVPREPATRTGGLTFDELAGLTPRLQSTTITPAPTAIDGRCAVSAFGNWGAPLDRQHPCAGYFPFIPVDGDLVITGGAGQGFLLVNGNLTIRDGAVFHGLVVAVGTLVIDGATVNGAIYTRSASPVLVLDGTIRLDPCAIANALFAARPLRRPLFPPARMWLPTH